MANVKKQAINDFRPQGCVTGIGSLPFTDPRAAVEFVAENCPEAPFWPQLPQRSVKETSMEQVLGPFADLLQRGGRQNRFYQVKPGRLDAFIRRLEYDPAYMDEAHAAGFFCFRDALAAGRFSQARAVKGQLVGPLTLAFHLFDGATPLVMNREFMSALGWYVTRLAIWQIDYLDRAGLPVLMFIDEPCLALIGPHNRTRLAGHLVDTLREVLVTLRQPNVITGLHCCTRPNLANINYIQPDLFSFDAHQYLETFAGDEATRPLLFRGGIIAFGLVPNCFDLGQVTAIRLFFHWLIAVKNLAALPELASRSMVTATCGLGLLDEAAACASFRTARETAALVEKVALEVRLPVLH